MAIYTVERSPLCKTRPKNWTVSYYNSYSKRKHVTFATKSAAIKFAKNLDQNVIPERFKHLTHIDWSF